MRVSVDALVVEACAVLQRKVLTFGVDVPGSSGSVRRVRVQHARVVGVRDEEPRHRVCWRRHYLHQEAEFEVAEEHIRGERKLDVSVPVGDGLVVLVAPSAEP